MFKPRQLLTTLRLSLGRALRAWSRRLLDADAARQRRSEAAETAEGDERARASQPPRDGPPAHWLELLRDGAPALPDDGRHDPDGAGLSRGMTIHYRADGLSPRQSTPDFPHDAMVEPPSHPQADNDGRDRRRPPAVVGTEPVPGTSEVAAAVRPAAEASAEPVDTGPAGAERSHDAGPGGESPTDRVLPPQEPATGDASVAVRPGGASQQAGVGHSGADRYAAKPPHPDAVRRRPAASAAPPDSSVVASSDRPNSGNPSRTDEYSAAPRAVAATTALRESGAESAEPPAATAPAGARSARPRPRRSSLLRRLAEQVMRLAGAGEVAVRDARQTPPSAGPVTAAPAPAVPRPGRTPDRHGAGSDPLPAGPADVGSRADDASRHAPPSDLASRVTLAPASSATWPRLADDDEVDTARQWPSLPGDTMRPTGGDPSRPAASQASPSAARRKRLDREQQGKLWNA